MTFEEFEALRLEAGFSVQRFCRVVGLPRASYYRRRTREASNPTAVALAAPSTPRTDPKTRTELRRRVVELAEAHPEYGHRKIWALLDADRRQVGRITVYRWLKQLGLLLPGNYQKELRERAGARAQYLHRPQQVNELWQVDITHVYVPDYGMYYVTNVVDYYSRYVLASHFSGTHRTVDVIAAVRAAMGEAERCGQPLHQEVVLVSDNGPQFISKAFRKFVKTVPIRHIRARSHHPETTGMVERYHQSLKYEEIWRNEYQDPFELAWRVEMYRKKYNDERPHEGLGYDFPAQVYRGAIQQVLTA